MAWVQTLIDACYFLAALLFILGNAIFERLDLRLKSD